jgi:hypothetical protein
LKDIEFEMFKQYRSLIRELQDRGPHAAPARAANKMQILFLSRANDRCNTQHGIGLANVEQDNSGKDK